jgi:hypothetical protein
MKTFFYSMLFAVMSFGLLACNSEQSTSPPPEKPKAMQDAEQVEAMMKEKAEADKETIEEASE